jgi:hypothetical protein
MQVTLLFLFKQTIVLTFWEGGKIALGNKKFHKGGISISSIPMRKLDNFLLLRGMLKRIRVHHLTKVQKTLVITMMLPFSV